MAGTCLSCSYSCPIMSSCGSTCAFRVAASKIQGGVVVLCTAEACRVKCASFQGGHPGQSGSKLLPARIVVSKVPVPFAGTASWPLLPRSAERKASRPMSMVDRPHPGAEQNGSHPNPNPFPPLELEGEASFHWDSDFAAMASGIGIHPHVRFGSPSELTPWPDPPHAATDESPRLGQKEK
ncbi:hypothetical protein PVAP13_4KG408201 [Panicum virgatum]|uniref:Uncharacterized protein n=1 Tax=Panicum virgatum TaxID=38727 RepID=A0A8T0TYD4_PANVG|nr:hypothetical protein PVAP13_4KG408201 [Panicum virgatum]